MISKLRTLNLALRGLMELSIVLALGYWGYQTGTSMVLKILLSILAPLLGFGFWSVVDFHQAGRLAEPLRLIQELAISGLAAYAAYVAGQPFFGWAIAILSVVHHILVYLLGDRLLKK